MKRLFLLTVAILLVALSPSTWALDVISLQNATATYYQPNSSLPEDFYGQAKTIDGIISGSGAWAIFRYPSQGGIRAETIVWETGLDRTLLGTTTFDLYHGDPIPSSTHYLGRFRLSYTTDDRTLFADGLGRDGDVDANWIVIDPYQVTSTRAEEFTVLGDKSILASGFAGDASSHPTYTVSAKIAATGVTGFRLEAMKDPSLPWGGPGREPTAGNFHLSEFVVTTAVPEPQSALLLAIGIGALVAGRRCMAGRTA